MRRTLAVFGGGALAIMLSQFPEYAQQYTQRLGGAVDELRIVAEDFERGAGEAGLTRQEAIARYEAAADPFLQERGVSMDRTLARYAELSAILARLRGADAWGRAQMLPELLDSEIGARTLGDFQPAVPVTIEGFAWAGAGFALGYLLVSALWRLLSMPFRRRYPSGGRI